MSRLLPPLALIFLAISGTAAYLARPTVRGSLAATEPLLDFGVRQQGDELAARFELVNQGREPVLIDRVESSCSCSSAEFAERALAAGQRTELRTTWKVGRHRGAINAQLTVVFKCGDRQERLALYLQAMVVPDYVFEPSELVFTRGRSETKVVELKPKPGLEVRVLRALADHRAF